MVHQVYFNLEWTGGSSGKSGWLLGHSANPGTIWSYNCQNRCLGDLVWSSDRTNDLKPRAVFLSCENKQLAVVPVQSFCFSGLKFLCLCNKRLKLIDILVSWSSVIDFRTEQKFHRAGLFALFTACPPVHSTMSGMWSSVNISLSKWMSDWQWMVQRVIQYHLLPYTYPKFHHHPQVAFSRHSI